MYAKFSAKHQYGFRTFFTGLKTRTIQLSGVALLVFIIAGSVEGQTADTAFTNRWIGSWSGEGQSGTLDVKILPNGSMNGNITNGLLKGTWTGTIGNDGTVNARYDYSQYASGQLVVYGARGVCQLNPSGQIVARVQFLYGNRVMGEGGFVLSRANALNTLSKPRYPDRPADYANPSPGQNNTKGGGLTPNVNDYRDDYESYIEALVPGYKAAVKGAMDEVHKSPASPNAPGRNQNRDYGSTNYGGSSSDGVPSFLLQGWIIPAASTVVATYDFTQMVANGIRTVEVRVWQQIGSLNWQSNQMFPTYTFTYSPASKEIKMRSSNGRTETWTILKVEDEKMLVERDGQQVYAYNCSSPHWPDIIKRSMRGCR